MGFGIPSALSAAEPPRPFASESLIVNGDTVEYFTEKKEIVATGKVAVDFKGTVLRCEKLTVNTQTQEAVAEGHVYVQDANGVMEGRKVIYNFNAKQGTVSDATFHSAPYYGKAKKIDLVSEKKFTAAEGYATTCNFDRPHYRIRSKKMTVFSGDKVRTKDDYLYFGQVPFMYLPAYSHSLKDAQTRVQIVPGYRKEWGAYVLTATRYSLADDIQGRLYLDYRDKLGFAEGAGVNYKNTKVGRGDAKFYYAGEHPDKNPAGQPSEYQRYFTRWRHQWEIDDRSNFIGEYFKIYDSKRKNLGTEHFILKDYFPREYDVDAQPLTYAQYSHAFTQSSVNVVVQKRVNNWFTQVEKLPEVKYNLLSTRLGVTPLFFEDVSQAAYLYNKQGAPVSVANESSVQRLDTMNKISLPHKISFIELTPFVGDRVTYYSQDKNSGKIDPRGIFYTGAQASTKFYRIYDVSSNALNLNLKGLRHIITPQVSYAFNNDPSIPSYKLVQVDSVDAIGKSNAATVELSNKLQTKRDDKTVDFANFIVGSTFSFYSVDPLTYQKSKDYWSDILFKLELLPYSWMQVHADADYNLQTDNFSQINYDLTFPIASERSWAVGQRYSKGGGNELTLGSEWRLTPKWKLHLFERYQVKDIPGIRKGLVIQEYGFSRDLHCWLMDFTLTREKEQGTTLWFIFKLKAFPEVAVDFRQGFSSPHSGSQNQ